MVIGFTEMEISILTWKKLNSPPRSAILRDFQNQEYRLIIPKSLTRVAEKLEEKEEEKQAITKGYAFHANTIVLAL